MLLAVNLRSRHPKTRGLCAALAACALVLAWARPAGAIIRVDVRVDAIYDVARLVVVGKVARIDSAARLIEVEASEVLKGELAGQTFALACENLPGTFPSTRVGDPVVLFHGARGATVHLADDYYGAASAAAETPARWNLLRRMPIQTRFPGRTAAIARVVRELKAGNSTLMNAMEHKVWRGGVRELGKVLPRSDYVLAGDWNGDGQADLIIGSEKATQFLASTPQGLAEKTPKSGLREARGRLAVVAEAKTPAGRDVLIGRTLWRNQGGHFVKGPSFAVDEGSLLVIGLLDVSGDEMPDALFLTRAGALTIFENPGADEAAWKELPPRALWSGGEEGVAGAFSSDWGDTGKAHVMVVRPSGITRYALEAEGGPPAEFERLCGETLESFNSLKNQTRWDVAGAVALHLNGDRRLDFIVFHEDGGPTFVNRGFGTFFLSTEPAVGIRHDKAEPVPWTVTAGTRFGAGDLRGDGFDDLLIVTEDGRLFALDNTPYPLID